MLKYQQKLDFENVTYSPFLCGVIQYLVNKYKTTKFNGRQINNTNNI